jgi:hypothetical protein
MNRTELTDAALDDLLRAHAPAPLAGDDFVARTLAAVDRASPRLQAARAATPLEIARALVAERERAALLARARRWGLAGVMAGVLLLVLAVLAAPAGSAGAAIASGGTLLLPLWLLPMAGAGWLAWQELRSA